MNFPGGMRNHGDTIRAQADRLQARLDKRGIPLEVLPVAYMGATAFHLLVSLGAVGFNVQGDVLDLTLFLTL